MTQNPSPDFDDPTESGDGRSDCGDGVPTVAGFDDETAFVVEQALARGYVDPVDHDD